MHISRILGLNRTYAMVLVSSNLGRLWPVMRTSQAGFEPGIFDVDEILVGNYHACCVINPWKSLTST